MKIIYGSIFFLFFTSTLYAQFDNVYGQRNNELRYNETARNVQFKKAGETVSYDINHVKGSPYINEIFIDGTVTLHNDSSIAVPLNYNAFIDAFEFLKDSTRYILTNNFSFKRIELKEKSFYYKLYKDKSNKELYGYFELIVDGNNRLFKKHKVDFKEPEPAETPLHLEKTARFSELYETYYLEINNALVVFNNKTNNSSLKYFEGCKDKIKIFIKENDLSFKKEKDLIQILEYINSISCI